ncbi:MAG: hypothetical protein MK135_14845, partial [Polyangiaceae bacterium]|nr:hypothetical protein [Polyangiaceae bacterium]
MGSGFSLKRRVFASLGCAAVALGTVSASAQSSETRVAAGNGAGMDTHLFRPAVDTKGFIAVNGTDVLTANGFSFGMYLDWGHTLMRTSDDSIPESATGEECAGPNAAGCQPGEVGTAGQGSKALIGDAFTGTITASYGIANMAIIGVSLPITVAIGQDLYGVGPTGATYNTGQLDSQKLTTVIPHVKVRILRHTDFIGLAFVGQV